MNEAQRLENGLDLAKIDLPELTKVKLLKYVMLIQKWNRVHNLTAIRDPEEMVILHLLDSLVVLPYLNLSSKSLLDVGSGAGLPGIVIALCMPNLKVTTIDSVNKKASFMRQVKAELAIENLNVISGRVEDYEPENKFDIVISRAFSEITQFMDLTFHLIENKGMWIAMKGTYPESEIENLKKRFQITPEVKEIKVPFLDAKRHLIFVKNNSLEV